MSRYRFELAGPADEGDLRQILAATPMAGAVRVRFEREPNFFAASSVEGTFRQIGAVRDLHSGRIVGFGSRAIRQRYVNGQALPIGYLSSLRLLAAHRSRGLVARGYAFLRELHQDGRTPFYLTTIAEGNDLALRLLTSGRAGLPQYHFAGRYLTAALPISQRRLRRPPAPPDGLTIRPVAACELPDFLSFLHAIGPQRQFFPRYSVADFLTPQGAFKDLQSSQLWFAHAAGGIQAAVAGWDQMAYRQTVIDGYEGPLRWLRPLVNAWSSLRSQPRLPAPGQPLRFLTAALPLARQEGRCCLRGVLDALLAQVAGGPWSHLLLGLHEDDPLLDVVRRFRPRWYVTRLYLVCWQDGEALRATLDGRVPYLELGSL